MKCPGGRAEYARFQTTLEVCPIKPEAWRDYVSPLFCGICRKILIRVQVGQDVEIVEVPPDAWEFENLVRGAHHPPISDKPLAPIS